MQDLQLMNLDNAMDLQDLETSNHVYDFTSDLELYEDQLSNVGAFAELEELKNLKALDDKLKSAAKGIAAKTNQLAHKTHKAAKKLLPSQKKQGKPQAENLAAKNKAKAVNLKANNKNVGKKQQTGNFNKVVFNELDEKKLQSMTQE